MFFRNDSFFASMVRTKIGLERVPGYNHLPRHLRHRWACLVVLSAMGEFPAG